MKINYENEIKDKKEFLEAKYKERDNILNNFENIKYSYFENLEKDIEKLENELEDLQLKFKNQYNNEYSINCKKDNNDIENNQGSNEILIVNGFQVNNKNKEFKVNNTKLIDKLIEDFDKYNLEMKQNINKLDINIKNKLQLNLHLNSIMAKIHLFKENYNDILSCSTR